MKLEIPKNADVQTSLRIPKENWDRIKELAKIYGCTPQEVIRSLIRQHIKSYD